MSPVESPLPRSVRRVVDIIWRALQLTSRRAMQKFGLRPSSYPYISGDSFRAFSQHVWDETGGFQSKDLGRGDVVFCKADLLESFCSQVLRHFDEPIVLLLGNSDFNIFDVPPVLRALGVKHSVFAQNLVHAIPHFAPLPIGLENRWWQNVGRPQDFDCLRRRKKPRTFRIMFTFNINTNKKFRKKADLLLNSLGVADDLGKIPPPSHRRALSRYAFVASPPGNGYDTHRTWEALYLGCVPIVYSSEFSRDLVEKGLPVWIVDSFTEIQGIHEEDLRARYEELRPGFDSPFLWLDAWTEEILKESTSLRSGQGKDSSREPT
jgi:hypothetical protein